MGHEFTGIVSEVGSDVHTLHVGDKVVSPFTVSWYVMPDPTMTQLEMSSKSKEDLKIPLT